MKIVHVVESFGGGVLAAVVSLANYFSDLGHDLEVIHSVRPDTPDGYRNLFSEKVVLTYLEMPQGISPFGDARAAKSLRTRLLASGADAIHLHSSKAGALGRLALARAESTARVFYTPHGFSFLRQDVSAMKRRLFHQIEGALQQVRPVRIVGCSEEETAAARAFDRNAVSAPNGVSRVHVEALAAQGLSHLPMDTRPCVVMTGRITAARAPERFELLARMLKSHPTQPHFVWVGDGSGYSFDPELVRVTGWLRPQDTLATVKQADIYLHCARWDALPFAVLEAMALARPVVATPVGALPQLILHGKTGYLGATDEELAQHLTGLLHEGSHARRAQLGAKGRARIESAYSQRQYFARWRRLYAGEQVA